MAAPQETRIGGAVFSEGNPFATAKDVSGIPLPNRAPVTGESVPLTPAQKLLNKAYKWLGTPEPSADKPIISTELPPKPDFLHDTASTTPAKNTIAPQPKVDVKTVITENTKELSTIVQQFNAAYTPSNAPTTAVGEAAKGQSVSSASTKTK